MYALSSSSIMSILQASRFSILFRSLIYVGLGLAGVCLAQGNAGRSAEINVDAIRVENRISPRMYAAFTEMMAEGVKVGLTPEMLRDRSFEFAPDYLGLPAGWQLEPDERNDNVGAIRFAPTTEEAYPKENEATHAPEHSLRVTLAPGDITDTERGLSQGRLSIVAGQQYRGYVWVKTPAVSPYRGKITVALGEDNTDGRHYATATLDGFSVDWRRYSFSLQPNTTDRFAKLSLLFDGTGTLYLDQASLEPAAATDHARPDTEAMVRELRPAFLRWPGGNVAQDYHWQWGVGPRDLRPVWINKSWSNAPEPNDFGTDEYLAFCERLHIEPSITVNVDGAGATPEEAAAWVEYVNGAASSHYGAMRAANGHPQPYGVKQWELGNEIFGNWVRGHAIAEDYANAAVRYAKAMRVVDPSLKLIAVGEGVFPGSDDWNRTVARIAGAEIQYLAIHDYTSASQNAQEPNPRVAMMAHAGEFEAHYRHIGDILQQASPGHPIRLIVNEWNLFYSSETIQSMDGAVYASRLMNGFERDGDIVEAHCISDLLNGWVGGVIQATRDRVYGTSQFYTLKMYRDVLGSERLAATVHSPQLEPGTDTVDAVATRSADGSKLFVTLSNADPNLPTDTNIAVNGFPMNGKADLVLLYTATSGARNSFSEPNVIAPRTVTLRCHESCRFTLPPDAVATLTIYRR
jgi:alpha-N-arabinofuranosidase